MQLKNLKNSPYLQVKIDIQGRTDQYIRSVPGDHITRTGKKVPGRTIYVFKLDTKTIEKIQEHQEYPQTNIFKCDEISGL